MQGVRAQKRFISFIGPLVSRMRSFEYKNLAISLNMVILQNGFFSMKCEKIDRARSDVTLVHRLLSCCHLTFD